MKVENIILEPGADSSAGSGFFVPEPIHCAPEAVFCAPKSLQVFWRGKSVHVMLGCEFLRSPSGNTEFELEKFVSFVISTIALQTLITQ